jgi:transcriptional regulator with XRE-family HTH domain
MGFLTVISRVYFPFVKIFSLCHNLFMEQEILQQNLRHLMKEQKLSMLKLSLAACLNETAIRDILNGKVKSPTYKTLQKIANALKCKVDDLVTKADDGLVLKKDSLLFDNSKINVKKFASTLQTVDELLRKKELKLSYIDKARVYFAWYDLTILNDNPLQDEKLIEAQLSTLINASKKNY